MSGCREEGTAGRRDVGMPGRQDVGRKGRRDGGMSGCQDVRMSGRRVSRGGPNEQRIPRNVFRTARPKGARHTSPGYNPGKPEGTGARSEGTPHRRPRGGDAASESRHLRRHRVAEGAAEVAGAGETPAVPGRRTPAEDPLSHRPHRRGGFPRARSGMNWSAQLQQAPRRMARGLDAPVSSSTRSPRRARRKSPLAAQTLLSVERRSG
jgi:hypothetical protein